MRVLVGIAQDAGDRGVGAADLLRDVAVEVLGRHDADGVCAEAGPASRARMTVSMRSAIMAGLLGCAARYVML